MGDSVSIARELKHRTVSLVGNPNTGKSTIFNALTGFRQRVGNFPGITVEKRTGSLRGEANIPPIDLIDLPGAYSLAARSKDEAVVLDVLLGRREGAEAPDLIVVVVDASNLARNLFLTTQLLEIGRPVVVALNMIDVAEGKGIHIDADELASELGIPVVSVVATKLSGLEALRHVVIESLDSQPTNHCADFPACVCAELDGLANSTSDNGEQPASRVEAIQTLLDPGGYHERQLVRRCGRSLACELAERRDRIEAAGESIVEVEGRVRYAWINRVVEKVTRRVAGRRRSRSEVIDRLLTNRVLGMFALLMMMGLCFQAVYSWAAPVMNLIESSLARMGGFLTQVIPSGALQSLLVNGVVAGVGAVLVFLPQILVLFLFIAILEDCGYMARAAFLLDRWMSFVGLNGKSFIPLLSSFACAVPGIMATRTIEDRRDRFVTILIAPLMSCSARLPIHVLLIGAFIPARPLLGGLVNLQAVTLLGLYLVGIGVAIVIAMILKRTILKGEAQSFLMELPGYKWPCVRTVLYRVYEQGREFCISAGTIIFAVTIVVWALGYYPHPASIAADYEAQRAALRVEHTASLDRQVSDYDATLTGETVLTYEPVASMLSQLEELQEHFDKSIAEDGLQRQSEEWTAARRELAGEMASIVAGSGDAGRLALSIHDSGEELEDRLSHINHDESGVYLRHSLLGRAGRWIEPVVAPMGWDWRIGTAVIASFPAREIVVATIGTIYNLGDQQGEPSAGLRHRLRSATWPDGRPVFNTAVALSIMVFFALCCQCVATLATIRRETRSWRWPLLTFTYMTTLAYVGAMLTYQIASRIT